MINDILNKMELILKGAKRLPDEKRNTLLALTNTLRQELDLLSRTHKEDADNLAMLTKLDTYQKLRETQNPTVSNHISNGLSSALTEFETSHPKLVEIIQSISISLSKLGI